MDTLTLKAQRKNLDSPDKIKDFSNGKAEIVNLDGRVAQITFLSP